MLHDISLHFIAFIVSFPAIVSENNVLALYVFNYDSNFLNSPIFFSKMKVLSKKRPTKSEGFQMFLFDRKQTCALTCTKMVHCFITFITFHCIHYFISLFRFRDCLKNNFVGSLRL